MITLEDFKTQLAKDGIPDAMKLENFEVKVQKEFDDTFERAIKDELDLFSIFKDGKITFDITTTFLIKDYPENWFKEIAQHLGEKYSKAGIPMIVTLVNKHSYNYNKWKLYNWSWDDYFDFEKGDEKKTNKAKEPTNWGFHCVIDVKQMKF